MEFKQMVEREVKTRETKRWMLTGEDILSLLVRADMLDRKSIPGETRRVYFTCPFCSVGGECDVDHEAPLHVVIETVTETRS